MIHNHYDNTNWRNKDNLSLTKKTIILRFYYKVINSTIKYISNRKYKQAREAEQTLQLVWQTVMQCDLCYHVKIISEGLVGIAVLQRV